jgi:hypothetical protein
MGPSSPDKSLSSNSTQQEEQSYRFRDQRLRNRSSNRNRNSNRNRPNPLSNLQPADYGIDRLSLSFLISEGSLDPDVWDVFSGNRSAGNGSREVQIIKGEIQIGRPPRDIRVVVFRGGAFAYTCTIEFNPARWVDPFGIGLCRPQDLGAVVSSVMRRVSKYITPIDDLEDFEVRRIDVTRNFYDITNPSRYLFGLRAVPKSRATFNRLFSNPASGVPETLEAGSKSGGKVMLYDKHAQVPSRAEPGTLRCEVQAHQSWCQRYGSIRTVSDLTAQNIDKLADDRFQWFGLEAEVMSYDTMCERIVGDESLSASTKIELLEYALARLRGDEHQMCSKTARKYSRLLRELNIAPYRESAMNFSISRLDFESGTEVQVA